MVKPFSVIGAVDSVMEYGSKSSTTQKTLHIEIKRHSSMIEIARGGSKIKLSGW